MVILDSIILWRKQQREALGCVADDTSAIAPYYPTGVNEMDEQFQVTGLVDSRRCTTPSSRHTAFDRLSLGIIKSSWNLSGRSRAPERAKKQRFGFRALATQSHVYVLNRFSVNIGQIRWKWRHVWYCRLKSYSKPLAVFLFFALNKLSLV